MRLFYTLAFTSLLTACGGGGGDSTPATPDAIDTVAPVITVKGEIDSTVQFEDAYTEEGATAFDKIDGNVSVTVTGAVDTSKVGSYEIVYSATDNSENSSSATRTINVVDSVSPVITLAGEPTITIEFNDVYTEVGATAIDNADGVIAVVTSGVVDTSKVGSYEIVYSAIDNSGNSSSETRTINVVDSVIPVITMVGEPTITVEFNDVYAELGATAIDNADGVIAVVTSGSVDTSRLGVYELVYTATDKSGNSSSLTRTVNVLTTIAGKVIDGYVSGATIWLDYNGNGKFDEQTEPSTISGEAGDYSFEFNEEQKQCLPYSTMYVDVPVGAVDADTGVVMDAYQMALPPSIDVLSDEELRHISPLTSSIWGLLRSQLQDSGKGNLSCLDLMDDIALREEIKKVVEDVILNAVIQYNLSEEQMFADFISEGNSDAYDTAQEIVKGLKAAYKHTLDLNVQYPDAREVRVVVYQSKDNDGRYNLDSAWYRDQVVFLENKTLIEDVKLKNTGALDQIDYVLTKLERVDSPWGDQTYNGVLSIRNDIYVNDDLTYRCGIIETIKLEKDSLTYQVSNSIPTVDHPTIETCILDGIDSPYERSFRVTYSVENINYFGVFFFRDDKVDFTSLSAWINVVDKADELEPNNVFTYMNALPYKFDTLVELDASYWRKRMTDGDVQVDTNNDNEWVRTTKLEDNTSITECSDDGINWQQCS
jgi:hypothetical protein